MTDSSAPRRSIPHYLHNWLSLAGLVLAAGAVFAFLFLFAIDLFGNRPDPYVGILAYVVAPFFFLLGMGLVFLGALLQRRSDRRAKHAAEPLIIRIDLSRPRDRRILVCFVIGSVIFLFLTAFGSYQTYHYTESVHFCGQQCHVPMEPQFVAFQHTAHAQVECVQCHVGPGASAYFKTKLNGVKQLYHTIRSDFDRPIRVSSANPRPPQAICEQCHWPKKYVGNVVRSYQHYLSDETNTPFTVRMLLDVGGGDPTNGPESGIHWHMNIANKIEYIAEDEQRLKIPWVRLTNRQGIVTVYQTPDFKGDPKDHQIQRMDCMDCHSRPAHRMHSPNEAVDLALSTGRLDPKIPWIKAKVVAALTKPYQTKPEALQAIADSLGRDYPDAAQAKPIIEEAQTIYRANFFPEMKVDWRTHPDFISHKDSNGCFRCHDGNHIAADGQKSISAGDCRSCHLILAQGNGEALNQIDPKGHPFIHIDSEYSEFACADCHTGGPQK